MRSIPEQKCEASTSLVTKMYGEDVPEGYDMVTLTCDLQKSHGGNHFVTTLDADHKHIKVKWEPA